MVQRRVPRPSPVGLVVVLTLWASGGASAQTPQAPVPLSRGTTVNVFGGAASASSEIGPLGGVAFGWEVTPRLTVEGSASWLDRHRGAKAFAAELKALVNLVPGRSVVPFLQGGVGLYRATFDPSKGEPPDFYGGRVTANPVGTTTATFTDPSFVVGGGVNMFMTRHLAIRPDIDAKIVRNHSQRYVVTAVSVHLAYHFEDHPITPSRSRR